MGVWSWNFLKPEAKNKFQRRTRTYINYLQQFAITNGLYVIDANGYNVYYYYFNVNQTSYAVKIIVYTVPIALPVGWTLPSN